VLLDVAMFSTLQIGGQFDLLFTIYDLLFLILPRPSMPAAGEGLAATKNNRTLQIVRQF
jgi:hypothetical protein